MIIYRELSSLEKDLGIPAKTLYGLSNHLDKHYHTVQIPRKSGGTRTLSVPDEPLKLVQRRILDVLLVHMPVSPYARAYRPGGSALRNARPHVGQAVVVNLDIYHFFNNIPYSMVKDRVFPEEIYAEPLRILLTMLCYHRDELPQGAPTSPVISNILMREFDETVGLWCRKKQIHYTRYCDDMTFSGSFEPKELIDFVGTELKKYNFLLNNQKTRIRRQGQQQTVTGIVVNEKLSVPASYRKKLWQEVYYIQKFGLRSHLDRLSPDIPQREYLLRLLGKVSYILQVDPTDPKALAARTLLQEAMKKENQR